MDSISFYDFDVTTGSEIQANALFDILDDLSFLVSKRRSPINNPPKNHQTTRNNDNPKGFP